MEPTKKNMEFVRNIEQKMNDSERISIERLADSPHVWMEEMWGLKDGLYLPLGMLSLPIGCLIYGPGQHGAGTESSTIIELGTILDPVFLERCEGYSPDLGYYSEIFSEAMTDYKDKLSGILTISKINNKNNSVNQGPRETIQRHIGKYFKLKEAYKDATLTENNSERIEMLRSFFRPYDIKTIESKVDR